MPARTKPKLSRAIERALLVRDRLEIAAAERLLGALKIEARKKTTTKKKRVR